MPAALANMHSNVDRHMYPLILISTITLTDFAHEYSLRITFLSHILISFNFLLCFPFPFECYQMATFILQRKFYTMAGRLLNFSWWSNGSENHRCWRHPLFRQQISHPWWFPFLPCSTASHCHLKASKDLLNAPVRMSFHNPHENLIYMCDILVH